MNKSKVNKSVLGILSHKLFPLQRGLENSPERKQQPEPEPRGERQGLSLELECASFP